MIPMLLALSLCAGHRYSPADAVQLFDAANDTYFKGDYAQAAEKYRTLAEDGWTGPDLEYNLGTALLAERKLGPAILAFRRARRLAPNDEDIVDNLERARHQLVDKVTGGGGDPFVTRVAELAPLRWVGWIFLGGYAALWLGIFARRRLRGFALALCAAGALCTVGAGALLAANWYQRERLHDAVVVGGTVRAREGPNDQSKVSFELHEGTELRIVDRQDGWVRVQLHNGVEAWAEAGGVEEI